MEGFGIIMAAILIISPEPWSVLFVSKHHYALGLADIGHDVIFYGPPEKVAEPYLERVCSDNGTLQILHSGKVIYGARFLPSLLRRFFERRWLRQIETLFGKEIDVIWNFENSRFYDFEFAGKRLKIYHQVDLNQDFNPGIAAATADLSIAISEPIEKRLSPIATNLLRITHGYAPSKDIENKTINFDDEFSKSRVNAVLTGNFDIPYLDLKLVNQLVCNFPDVRFHFVGDYSPDKDLHTNLEAKDNVIFWGRQPSESLPLFFRHANILLVVYLANAHREQLANPHKIMEYLASGKCVLATYTMEYDGREDLIEMASNRDEFIQKFLNIVRCPSAWNSPELMSYRQNFANSNSYPRQIERIADALGERGHLLSSRIFHDE